MTSLEVKELQDSTIQILNTFSVFQSIKFKVHDDFIRKKISQISEQNEKFRDAIYKSVTHARSMRIHAEDLTDFIEFCKDDDISNDELLELLSSSLRDFRKDKENALLLTNQLKKVKEDLSKITEEIFEYEAKISKKRDNLNGKVEKAKQVKGGATKVAIGGLLTAGVGTLTVVAGIAAVPLTGGASLVAVEFGMAAIDVGSITYFGGSVVADASLIAGTYLDYKLDSVSEEFSQVLRELQNGIEKVIIGNTSHFESGWEGQMIEIENIIEKLNDQHGNRRLTKLFVKRMAPKAEKTRKNLEKYIEVMQQVLRPNSRIRNL